MDPHGGNLPYVGRFAPSPTGRIHVGVARTFLAAWLDARRQGGVILLRIEDIDRPRTVPGAADQIRRDLEWLGLDWDGEVVEQSARFDRYEAAVERLRSMGRIYACTCSRKEIALASAPHGEGDDGPRYPGTCRAGTHRSDRPASLRLRTEPGDVVRHEDRAFGPVDQDVHSVVGDFVLHRADGLWAYQLAVAVDDLEQGVTTIVRGRDLLHSTPRQLLLRRLLDVEARPLATLHVPILLGPEGKRLAKRDGPIAIADHRDAGVSPAAMIGRLAASLGLVPIGTRITASEVVPRWDPERIPIPTNDQVWEAT
jgi:glutamyl-tRNA synthetase